MSRTTIGAIREHVAAYGSVPGYLAGVYHAGEQLVLAHGLADLWIVAQCNAASDAAAWIADKRAALADREFRALYLAYDRAFAWSSDDRRLTALAARTQRWLASRRRATGPSTRPPPIAQLVASAAVASPAWERLAQLVARIGLDRRRD